MTPGLTLPMGETQVTLQRVRKVFLQVAHLGVSAGNSCEYLRRGDLVFLSELPADLIE